VRAQVDRDLTTVSWVDRLLGLIKNLGRHKIPENSNLIRFGRRRLFVRRWPTITRREEASLFVFFDKFGGDLGSFEDEARGYELFKETNSFKLISTLERSSSPSDLFPDFISSSLRLPESQMVLVTGSIALGEHFLRSSDHQQQLILRKSSV
jgi:hypothetical protein